MPRRFEPTALIGLIIGLSAIALSMLLDGTKLRFLWQPSALLIVLGGTIGAVTVKSGLSGIIAALRQFLAQFSRKNSEEDEAMIARLAWLAKAARREGKPVLERYAQTIEDPLVARGLELAAEYSEPNLVASCLDSLLDEEDQQGQRHVAAG